MFYNIRAQRVGMKTYSTDEELEDALTIDLVMTGEDLTVFVCCVLEEVKAQSQFQNYLCI